MHVKCEDPTTGNELSCSRQSDLKNDINQQLISFPTLGKRDLRENYWAAPWLHKIDLLKLSKQTRSHWLVMNGSSSIQFLPSATFLSDTFVVFSQKVVHCSREFLERDLNPGPLRVQNVRKRQQRHAKPKQPPAPRRSWRGSISPISCCLLLVSFFCLWI